MFPVNDQVPRDGETFTEVHTGLDVGVVTVTVLIQAGAVTPPALQVKVYVPGSVNSTVPPEVVRLLK